MVINLFLLFVTLLGPLKDVFIFALAEGWSAGVYGRFPFNKNSGLKFRKLHVLNGTVHSGCTDPTQATARFVIVASQHTHNYALKEKRKYCLYPKEHSTVEKGRWQTKGGGILFRVESL